MKSRTKYLWFHTSKRREYVNITKEVERAVNIPAHPDSKSGDISYDKYAGDSLFEELVERLKTVSSEFRRLWSNHDVLGRDDGYRELYHPLVGKMAFQHGTFQVYNSPDLKLFLFSNAIKC